MTYIWSNDASGEMTTARVATPRRHSWTTWTRATCAACMIDTVAATVNGQTGLTAAIVGQKMTATVTVQMATTATAAAADGSSSSSV